MMGVLGAAGTGNPKASRHGQLGRAQALLTPSSGSIVAEYFDVGQTRALPWKRRPVRQQLGLVLVPSLYLVTEAAAANLARFTERGGTPAVGFHSGMADENGHVFLGGYPGAFRDVLGVLTDELFPLLPGETTGLTGEVPPGATADLWSERVRLAGARAVASYADGLLAGHPAVTRHQHGSGTAWSTELPPAETQFWRGHPSTIPARELHPSAMQFRRLSCAPTQLACRYSSSPPSRAGRCVERGGPHGVLQDLPRGGAPRSEATDARRCRSWS